MTTDTFSTFEVARYMAEQLEKKGELYQEDVVCGIKRIFGNQYVYTNENGNLAIDRAVLKEFRRLTPDAVWERGERMWRRRASYDDKKKRMQDW